MNYSPVFTTRHQLMFIVQRMRTLPNIKEQQESWTTGCRVGKPDAHEARRPPIKFYHFVCYISCTYCIYIRHYPTVPIISTTIDYQVPGTDSYNVSSKNRIPILSYMWYEGFMPGTSSTGILIAC